MDPLFELAYLYSGLPELAYLNFVQSMSDQRHFPSHWLGGVQLWAHFFICSTHIGNFFDKTGWVEWHPDNHQLCKPPQQNWQLQGCLLQQTFCLSLQAEPTMPQNMPVVSYSLFPGLHRKNLSTKELRTPFKEWDANLLPLSNSKM